MSNAATRDHGRHAQTRTATRARMVRSAATLIRERGIHGTGLRQVVARSGGPRGSLGRFFPGGKTQLVTEAIDVALVDLFDDLDRPLSEAETFPEAISVIVTPWRRLLVDHDFALGCPLAATICDAADNDSLRTHVGELLARWRAPVADAYTRFGAPQAEAEAHATVLMAALEGALMLARAQRDIEPLDTVERFFAVTCSRPTPSIGRHTRRGPRWRGMGVVVDRDLEEAHLVGGPHAVEGAPRLQAVRAW